MDSATRCHDSTMKRVGERRASVSLVLPGAGVNGLRVAVGQRWPQGRWKSLACWRAASRSADVHRGDVQRGDDSPDGFTQRLVHTGCPTIAAQKVGTQLQGSDACLARPIVQGHCRLRRPRWREQRDHLPSSQQLVQEPADEGRAVVALEPVGLVSVRITRRKARDGIARRISLEATLPCLPTKPT